jgi:hypothetical protein
MTTQNLIQVVCAMLPLVLQAKQSGPPFKKNYFLSFFLLRKMCLGAKIQ